MRHRYMIRHDTDQWELDAESPAQAAGLCYYAFIDHRTGICRLDIYQKEPTGLRHVATYDVEPGTTT